MYIKVTDIVPKCTEKSEGIRVYEQCRCSISDEKVISIDFEGIMQVTDEFVFALLGELAKDDKTAINRIQYVRIKTYIKTKFKRASRRLVEVA